MRKFLVFLLLLLFNISVPAADAKELQVITYNIGMAKKLGIEFVPCVDERLQPLMQVISAAVRPPFVLFLQEAWTGDSQDAIREWVKSKRYHMYSESPGQNGLMIVSSERLFAKHFSPFSSDNVGLNRGILEARIRLRKKSILLLNTHTTVTSVDEVSQMYRDQLNEITDRSRKIKRGPSILAGDFNVGPDLTFLNGKYDPVAEIWEKLIASQMNPTWTWAGEKTESGTWDNEHNPLVSKPSETLSVLGLLDENGSWGYSNSTIDHIFVSKEFKILRKRLVFNTPVPVLGCESHALVDLPNTSTYLSDHYGWEALLSL